MLILLRWMRVKCAPWLILQRAVSDSSFLLTSRERRDLLSRRNSSMQSILLMKLSDKSRNLIVGMFLIALSKALAVSEWTPFLDRPRYLRRTGLRLCSIAFIKALPRSKLLPLELLRRSKLLPAAGSMEWNGMDSCHFNAKMDKQWSNQVPSLPENCSKTPPKAWHNPRP